LLPNKFSSRPLQNGPGSRHDGVDRTRRPSPLPRSRLSHLPVFHSRPWRHRGLFCARWGNNFQPDLAEIESKITAKTRALIFNSPNNPTGTVFAARALAGIAALAIQHDLWVITDEIYARILFNGEYQSIWTLPGMAERTIIIDGFSKSLP